MDEILTILSGSYQSKVQTTASSNFFDDDVIVRKKPQAIQNIIQSQEINHKPIQKEILKQLLPVAKIQIKKDSLLKPVQVIPTQEKKPQTQPTIMDEYEYYSKLLEDPNFKIPIVKRSKQQTHAIKVQGAEVSQIKQKQDQKQEHFPKEKIKNEHKKSDKSDNHMEIVKQSEKDLVKNKDKEKERDKETERVKEREKEKEKLKLKEKLFEKKEKEKKEEQQVIEKKIQKEQEQDKNNNIKKEKEKEKEKTIVGKDKEKINNQNLHNVQNYDRIKTKQVHEHNKVVKDESSKQIIRKKNDTNGKTKINDRNDKIDDPILQKHHKVDTKHHETIELVNKKSLKTNIINQKNNLDNNEHKQKQSQQPHQAMRQDQPQKTKSIVKFDGTSLKAKEESERLLQILNGTFKKQDSKKVKQIAKIDSKQTDMIKKQEKFRPNILFRPTILSNGPGETQKKIPKQLQQSGFKVTERTKEDDEYDLNDSFIDNEKFDAPDSDDQRELNETFGRIRKRMYDHEEDEGDIPEDSFEEMQRQERQSRYIGKVVDDKELQFIQIEEERERKRQKKA